jgi:hypothetical protein
VTNPYEPTLKIPDPKQSLPGKPWRPNRAILTAYVILLIAAVGDFRIGGRSIGVIFMLLVFLTAYCLTRRLKVGRRRR